MAYFFVSNSKKDLKKLLRIHPSVTRGGVREETLTKLLPKIKDYVEKELELELSAEEWHKGEFLHTNLPNKIGELSGAEQMAVSSIIAGWKNKQEKVSEKKEETQNLFALSIGQVVLPVDKDGNFDKNGEREGIFYWINEHLLLVPDTLFRVLYGESTWSKFVLSGMRIFAPNLDNLSKLTAKRSKSAKGTNLVPVSANIRVILLSFEVSFFPSHFSLQAAIEDLFREWGKEKEKTKRLGAKPQDKFSRVCGDARNGDTPSKFTKEMLKRVKWTKEDIDIANLNMLKKARRLLALDTDKFLQEKGEILTFSLPFSFLQPFSASFYKREIGKQVEEPFSTKTEEGRQKACQEGFQEGFQEERSGS